MIIARLNPEERHELLFDLNISGSKEEPQDIRFIIESQIDPDTGETVDDVFSIICRAVRSPDGVKVTIPRLLNLFRAGSYKSRLEVVLEGRLFVPLNEEIAIEEPAKVELAAPIKETKEQTSISVSLTNIVTEITKPKEQTKIVEETKFIKPESVVEKIQPVDKSWRKKGFEGMKNPFKKDGSKNL